MSAFGRDNVWKLFILIFILSMLIVGNNCFRMKQTFKIKRQQYSSSESCAMGLIGVSLTHPGCQSKRVIATACRGTCHSRAVPEWRYEEQVVRLVHYCTCCEPLSSLSRAVTLTCPNTSTGFRVFRVSIPVKCACRPCSDGNPEAEQPYDY